MRLAKLLKSSLISIWCVTTSAQLFATEQNRTPAAYFMEQPPADIEPNNIPKGAQDVIVAKVRLDQPVLFLGGRHCEGCTNDILGARLKIVEVRAGSAQIDQELFVHFGQRSEHREEFITYPTTPDQQSREYTVVSYLDGDGKRRLVPFQISKLELEKWQAELLAYDRERRKNNYRE